MRIFRMQRWGRASALATLALALAGAYPAGGQPAPTQTPASRSGEATATKVVSDIHAINQMEIMMGQLAQRKGSTPRVRRYGLLLARDHRQGDQQLLALARDQRLGIAAVGTSPADQAMMQKLQGLSGKEFDRQFLADMNAGHEKAIAMLKGSTGELANASVRDFVGKIVPILGQHRDLSQHLGRKA